MEIKRGRNKVHREKSAETVAARERGRNVFVAEEIEGKQGEGEKGKKGKNIKSLNFHVRRIFMNEIDFIANHDASNQAAESNNTAAAREAKEPTEEDDISEVGDVNGKKSVDGELLDAEDSQIKDAGKEEAEPAADKTLVSRIKDEMKKYRAIAGEKGIHNAISLAGWDKIDQFNLFIAITCKYFIRKSAAGVKIYNEKTGIYENYNKATLRSFVKQHIPLSLRNKKLINATAEEIEAEVQNMDDDLWDTDESGVNVRNGYYHIDGKKLVPHDPKYLSTKQLPFEYIPNKRLEDAQNFYSYLEHSWGADLETRDFILDFMALTISNIRGSRIKGILMLFGPGDSGKTIARELLIALVGRDRSTSIGMARLSQKFGSWALLNARIVGEGDVSGSEAIDFSNFKNYTGNDESMVEGKFKNISKIKFRGLFLFIMNALPPIKGDKGDAVFSRLYIVPFKNIVPPENRNSDFLKLLLEEKDIIGSVLLDRLKNIVACGCKLTPSENMLK